MKRNQSGFTLIEIAIVLVIIGLLLGGVLKGQELINSAKVKNLGMDFKNIPVFLYGYQDKFKALPGDDSTVVTHVGGSLASTGGTVGNGIIEGNWNSITKTEESYLFWQHVRLAGLAPGVTTLPTTPAHGDGYLPVNASGGEIGFQSGTTTVANSPMFYGPGATNPIRGSYIICSTGILGKFVKQLDTTMDDGNTATGSMIAAPTTGYVLGTATAAATATTSIDDAATYTVCMGV